MNVSIKERCFRIALRKCHQRANAPHSLGLLAVCGERPCCPRTAKQRDEFAPFQ